MEVLTKPSKVVATASEILNHSCWSEQLDRRRKSVRACNVRLLQKGLNENDKHSNAWE